MAEEAQQDDGRTVLVVGPDGRPLGTVDVDGQRDGDDTKEDPSRLIEQPAKVMRIGNMIKQLLEEVRAAPLDEAGLAPELRDELERITLPFADGTPSEPELRIAQAQLVGWLEGLFHGIQAALVAQQMAARAQLEHMRGRPALPMGRGMPGMPGQQGEGDSPGQYL